MPTIELLLKEMIEFDGGNPALAQHLVKVHAFSRMIALMEGVDGGTMRTLEAAAAVHDIAILTCLKRYGRDSGGLQEQEGPQLAREMLVRLGFEPEMIERVCFLVGHHHTFEGIDGIDHQILVEADFLVNLYENKSSPDTVRSVYERIFKTATGKALCRAMFLTKADG